MGPYCHVERQIFFREQITECTMIQQYTQKTVYIGIVYQHAILAEK